MIARSRIPRRPCPSSVSPDWPRLLVQTDFPAPRELLPTPPALMPFVDGGIVFTPGSGNRHARRFFAAAIDATARLDAMNRVGGGPWKITFSYSRALQAAPQKAWSGKAENVAAAQAAFTHRAAMNGLASMGKWSADLEKKAA